jgi:hypothetical protein
MKTSLKKSEGTKTILQETPLCISKYVVTRLAYVLVRAIFFNENIKQSYGFPQTTSFKTILHEEHKCAIVMLKEFYCVDGILTDDWKGPNFKL